MEEAPIITNCVKPGEQMFKLTFFMSCGQTMELYSSDDQDKVFEFTDRIMRGVDLPTMRLFTLFKDPKHTLPLIQPARLFIRSHQVLATVVEPASFIVQSASPTEV